MADPHLQPPSIPKATSLVLSAYQFLFFLVPQRVSFSASHLLGFSVSQLLSLPAPQLLSIPASGSQLLSTLDSQPHNSISAFQFVKFSSSHLINSAVSQLHRPPTSDSQLFSFPASSASQLCNITASHPPSFFLLSASQLCNVSASRLFILQRLSFPKSHFLPDSQFLKITAS